jgi:transketolase
MKVQESRRSITVREKITKSNSDLRLIIAEMVAASGEGHIPSSFSIIDILEVLYSKILRFKVTDPDWNERDYFVLSKGHGAAALFAVLNKVGIISKHHLDHYGLSSGILGGHPDTTNVPGAEASTGSLGHGFPTAVGIALGLRIKEQKNRVYCLVGDGECHEGTIWESANIASNLKLGNLCVVVDFNGSAKQLMPHDEMASKWRAFGWKVIEVDGHDTNELLNTFQNLQFEISAQPTVVVANTVKGKGVSFTEGHGIWHHRIPTENEMNLIRKELLS